MEDTGSHILIVDDSIINQRVLTSVLEKQNYRVSCANDGEEALNEATSSHPDLILLDVQMPKMDGFEVCRALKAMPETADIPVVFITASDSVESKVSGFQAGGADYISRPLKMPEVLARVSNQLTILNLKRENLAETQRLETILGALPVPYLISEYEGGKILEINDLALACFKLERDELQDFKSIDFYANPEDRKTLLSESKDGTSIANREIELKDSEGQTFTALYNATPIILQSGAGFFVTFNDISERKKMEEALEKAATTDYLTGVLNRRSFTENAEAERQRSDRNDQPVSILMIDIDHFKKINDTYGHDVGDMALKVLVEEVARDLRSSDALGRIGGEEFALLMPETDLEGGNILSERIRERVEERVIEQSKADNFSMTISGGISQWNKGESLDVVLKRCDEALYEAKQTGRNKIVQK